MHLISEMTRSARELGASSVLGLIPENGPRWGRRVGLDIDVIGRVMQIGDTRNVCIRINLADKLH
jgi:N-acyl-L-homoserine lactone synthetase